MSKLTIELTTASYDDLIDRSDHHTASPLQAAVYDNKLTRLTTIENFDGQATEYTSVCVRRGIRSRPYGLYRVVYILSRRECLDAADNE